MNSDNFPTTIYLTQYTGKVSRRSKNLSNWAWFFVKSNWMRSDLGGADIFASQNAQWSRKKQGYWLEIELTLSGVSNSRTQKSHYILRRRRRWGDHSEPKERGGASVMSASYKAYQQYNWEAAFFFSLHQNEDACPGYNTQIYLMVRLQFWRSSECIVPLHCHYSKVHSD